MRQAPMPRARVAARVAVPAIDTSRLADMWRKLMKELLDPYRPELYYMRGPGPKWREKHGATDPR